MNQDQLEAAMIITWQVLQPRPQSDSARTSATYWKKRGWCVMLLSCSTRRRSLCCCSILCFCSSAPSVSPSSSSLQGGAQGAAGITQDRTQANAHGAPCCANMCPIFGRLHREIDSSLI